MQKNFVQRHALFFSVIVFCFVIVPLYEMPMHRKKQIKSSRRKHWLSVHRSRLKKKRSQSDGLFWMPVTAAMMTAVLRRMAQRKKTLHCS